MNSKKTIKNIIFDLAAQLIIMICGFIVPRTIIKFYGSEVNGLLVSITQFLGYITLLEAGVGPVVKAALYKPLAKSEKNKISTILKESEIFFKTIAKIFIIYLIILSLIYPLIINSSFDYLFSLSLIIIISISTFAEYYFGITYRLLLQSDQKGYIISLLQIVTYILTTILTIILANFGTPIQVLKILTATIFVIRPILQKIYVKKKYSLCLPKKVETKYLTQKKDSLAQHVAAIINNNTDVAVLTILSTLQEVSIYSIYCLVTKGLKVFIDSIMTAVSPTFGNLIAKEDKKLQQKFSAFESSILTLSAIVFSCALVLITPFVTIYTSDIADLDYRRPIFGILICLATFVWCVRLPYNSLALAAGHFKETKKGAWAEAIINILLSIILVINYGLIGVAIGTLVAVTIRTIEFVYHSNKYIIKQKMKKSIQKILMIIAEVCIVFIVFYLKPLPEISSYTEWAFNALKVFIISILVIIPINCLLFKNDLKNTIIILKSALKRSKK